MPRRPTRDLAVGALFALALIVLALGIMAVGGEVPWLSSRVNYRVVFPEAGGLLLGAPVRIAGVDVGTVSNIRLPTDPGEQGIEVQIAVESAYAPRIREDSRASLRILQLLTNEKFVEILPGSPDRAAALPGSEIQRRTETGYIEQGEAIAENLGEITASLKAILVPLEQGEGLLGKVIQDPEFGLAGVEALSGVVQNMQTLTADIRAGKGTVGRLLYDEQLAAKLDDLGRAAEDLSSLIDWVNERRGVLKEMLEEDGTVMQTMRDVREASASFRRIAERLDSQESFLGQLMASECVDSVSDDVCATLHNISSITDKIDRGEGTLGALVNDRALYDSAEDVVVGVNDSKFARWLTRRYRKKGIVAQDKEQEKAGKPD